MDNSSARNLWGDFLDSHLEYAFAEKPKVIHLYDNPKDANKNLRLILSGKKRAITHSLIGMQQRQERLPKIGDFVIITDWKGKAKCIVRTVAVRIAPFFTIRESYAKLEGNGSLDKWKKWYWDYYTREFQEFGRQPRESMIVVCQIFEKVYQRKGALESLFSGSDSESPTIPDQSN